MTNDERKTGNLGRMKTCEACRASFECNAGDIMNCQCYAVKVPAHIAPVIKEQYNDCLCAACLQEIIQKETGRQKQEHL